jgi:hypothetical protein
MLSPVSLVASKRNLLVASWLETGLLMLFNFTGPEAALGLSQLDQG